MATELDQDMAEAAANPTVTIGLDEYEKLLDQCRWLTALEDAGVDNWSGIDYAQELYRAENE